MVGEQQLCDRREVEGRRVQGNGVRRAVGDFDRNGALDAVAELDDKALAGARRRRVNYGEG